MSARLREKIAYAARARLGRPHALPNLHPAKLELIDYAAEFLPFASFADLGGVWHVDGGYSLYALRKGAERGVLVDEGAHRLSARPRSEPRLAIVEANFADREAAARVGDVDAIFHSTRCFTRPRRTGARPSRCTRGERTPTSSASPSSVATARFG